MGPPVVERLIVLLTPGKGHTHTSLVRRNAVRALGQIGDAGALEALITALHDDDVLIRAEAAEALGRLGDGRAVEPLIKALDDGYAVGSAAARALGRLGDGRAVEPLIDLLHGCYECGREAAAEALGQLGDARAVQPLASLLQDEDAEMRKIAAQALARIGWRPDGSEAKAAFLVALQDWPGCVTMGADAVHQLIITLRSGDFAVAWHAGNALVAIGRPAIEPLHACLSDPNPGVRADALRLLSELGAVAPSAN